MTTRVEDKTFPTGVVFGSLKRGDCFRFASQATPAMRVVNEKDPGPHYMFLTGYQAFVVYGITANTQVIPIDAHIIVG